MRFVGGGEYITLNTLALPVLTQAKKINSPGRTLFPPRDARYHFIV